MHETHGMSRNLFKGYILTLISICILPIVLIHYSTLHTFVGCGLVLPFSDAVSCNTSYFDFFIFFLSSGISDKSVPSPSGHCQIYTAPTLLQPLTLLSLTASEQLF